MNPGLVEVTVNAITKKFYTEIQFHNSLEIFLQDLLIVFTCFCLAIQATTANPITRDWIPDSHWSLKVWNWMSLTPNDFLSSQKRRVGSLMAFKKKVLPSDHGCRDFWNPCNLYIIYIYIRIYIYLPTFYHRKIGKYTLHGCYGKLSSALLVGKDVSEAIETSMNKFE